MKSIYVDWSSEIRNENWEFVGRRILEKIRGEWSKKNPNGIECDEGYPIYNYAYPLFSDELTDETILRVCEETACTVVYSENDGKYYLALTGCGMDMSQSIALAYLIADGCIDWDFLEYVAISGPLSVGREQYIELMEQLNGQLGIAKGNLHARQKEVRATLREYRAAKKSEKQDEGQGKRIPRDGR